MSSLRLNAASPVPVFLQIVEGLRSQIAAGVYRPGERVPSVRQQALALVVNPNTVQRAYEELERQGLLEGQRGIGMVVAGEGRPAAKQGASDSVAATLAGAVETALAAGLPRRRVDAMYRQAWADAGADARTDESDEVAT